MIQRYRRVWCKRIHTNSSPLAKLYDTITLTSYGFIFSLGQFHTSRIYPNLPELTRIMGFWKRIMEPNFAFFRRVQKRSLNYGIHPKFGLILFSSLSACLHGSRRDELRRIMNYIQLNITIYCRTSTLIDSFTHSSLKPTMIAMISLLFSIVARARRFSPLGSDLLIFWVLRWVLCHYLMVTGKPRHWFHICRLLLERNDVAAVPTDCPEQNLTFLF